MATERLERLVARLNRMESPDEVADYLRSQDIKGNAAFSTSCPIACLIKRGRVKGTLISVASGNLMVWNRSKPNSTKFYDWSPAMTKFICNVDDGEYPDLTEGVD